MKAKERKQTFKRPAESVRKNDILIHHLLSVKSLQKSVISQHEFHTHNHVMLTTHTRILKQLERQQCSRQEKKNSTRKKMPFIKGKIHGLLQTMDNSLFVFQWHFRGLSAYQLSSKSSEPALHRVPVRNKDPAPATAVPKDCLEENKSSFH
ncbi:hypothetical protein PoB_006813400 [Plakobranchus ocellatus]|uniref:Uncharacterized protein n=1 Tax=Plakobranchus ocellatus TaxID=259542 RepID=A0AAV4DBQ4_9GAST|nr:hypothetical protein PoB_006813400 [Plakobranchus ocellatus]